MLSDSIALALSVSGILFLLFCFIFKLMVWKEEGVTISIPLKSNNKDFQNRIINLREICSFLGIQQQCTIVVVNYGASEYFFKELKDCFSDYSFIKFINKDELIKELHT